MEKMRRRIEEILHEMWKEDHTTDPPVLADNAVLLELGYDSMTYAVLVARLDDEFGVDPFLTATDVPLPRTFGDFVAFYEQSAPAQ
jgi:acyl carrier protein